MIVTKYLLNGDLWHTFIMPALKRFRQDRKFKAGLGSIVKLYFRSINFWDRPGDTHLFLQHLEDRGRTMATSLMLQRYKNKNEFLTLKEVWCVFHLACQCGSLSRYRLKIQGEKPLALKEAYVIAMFEHFSNVYISFLWPNSWPHSCLCGENKPHSLYNWIKQRCNCQA